MNTHHKKSIPFNDIRDTTFKTRKDIGFSERESWREATASFDDHTLKIQGHPVMEDWEDSYMRELADIAASGGGIVLEVGYGMGISARYIQRHQVSEHLIIEANMDVFRELQVFAEDAPQSVIPLYGFWEDITSQIPSGSISGILFDTYPLCEEDHVNHFPFFKEAFRLLRPDGVLTYYSDEISDYSPQHRAVLAEAGFTNIDKRVCHLDTPPDCTYWKSETMLAPIIRK
jgi:guanidinoacetate N-methyltransferase